MIAALWKYCSEKLSGDSLGMAELTSKALTTKLEPSPSPFTEVRTAVREEGGYPASHTLARIGTEVGSGEGGD